MLKDNGLTAVLLILFVAIAASSAPAQDSQTPQVDSILGTWYGEQTPSVGVLIMQQGEVKVRKSYGFANLEEETRADAHTNYDLATLTEQFTVMATLILQEEKQWDKKTPVSELLPDLPGYCEGITLQHLFNHTSGLPLLPQMNFYDDIRSYDDLLDFLAEHDGLKSKPGKSAQQNPVNDALLAQIIERSTGDSYRDIVGERIFDALGMEDSRVYKKGWFRKVPSKATSYLRKENNQYEDTGGFPDSYLEGAIGVFSNLRDMQRWLLAWETDTLISRNLLNSAQRINFRRGQKNFPGYGWTRAFNNGTKYLYQGGIGPGTSHIILKVPGEKISVVILSNQSSLFGLRKRAFELVNLFSEKKYETR